MGLVNADDRRWSYRQIADDLRSVILSGGLPPGSRLPSTRELMDRYDVSNQTVQNAVRLLRDDGLVTSEPGRGTFVCADIDQGEMPSPTYLEILSQLAEISGEIERIGERLDRLEADVPTPDRGR